MVAGSLDLASAGELVSIAVGISGRHGKCIDVCVKPVLQA
jgi:hypothetical protein